ncbi:MAG: hypothetical protein ACI9EF_000242 [Pseudohongiellaceae bacterium]|jgi:hypothetical protein
MNTLNLRPSLFSSAAIALAGLAIGAPHASAGGGSPDFSAVKLEVNQAVQINGTTTVIGDRSTMVRTHIRLSGTAGGSLPVDGIMRVFVDGVEAAFSPIYSDNGPVLTAPAPVPTLEDGTLNFVFIPPISDDVVIQVEVNPAGPNQVAEANATNNMISSPQLDFIQQAVADFVYSPIDLRPGGGATPNLPDPNLIKPGVGDNFIQGAFPGGELLYRRTDAPSKLWTSSVASSGTALNSSLAADLNLMNPKPDRIYGWVPGSISYNGQAQLPGVSGMGNTQNIRHQRTYAHEMGHTFGFFHTNQKTNHIGVDVERQLNITESLPLLKPTNLNDIMVPGLLTPQAWIALTNYNNLINDSVFQFNDSADAAALVTGPTLFVGGSVHAQTGAVELYDLFSFEGGELTQPASALEANLYVKAWSNGELVVDMPILSRTSNDDVHGDCSDDSNSDSNFVDPLVGFTFILPAVGPHGAVIDRIQVDTSSYADGAPFEVALSSNAPEASFTSPSSSILSSGQLTVTWDASDADGDALQFYLRYSPDGGERMVPLMSSLSQTSFDVDMSTLPRLIPGEGFFELMTSDGLHTTKVRSAPLTWGSAFNGVGGLDPHVNVMTPDAGMSYPQGGTVILHAGAWDIDDKALLDGGDVTWTSDVDGLVGTGRHTSTASLTVGVHNITVEGTDGSGATSSDVTTITITARGLPLGEFCQPDLGFGGPGSSVLSVCGGDLSTGTTANVLLSGAPASTTAFLVLGLAAAPTPFKGGQLVPLPSFSIVAMTTSVGGNIMINNIPGGSGPASLVAQYVIVDGAQPVGFGLSNAVQLNYLP